ncbi:MAG: ABC transporter ATP-binding protein [bacterium]|nr:ABC transporter ATP-binding protein [bacterium]
MHNGPRGPKMNKSKDFVGSMKRLFKELKSFQILIAMALIFAVLSSVLSIAAPNKLSKLTDTISEGVVVNSRNLEEVSERTKINLQNIKVDEILQSEDLTIEEKQDFLNALQFSSEEDIVSNLSKLSDNTLKMIFKEFTVKNQKITTSDQIKFLEVASTVKDTSDVKALYKKIDEMPKDIKKVVVPTMNMTKIKKISLFLACLYIVSALLSFIESIIMTSVSNNFARKLRGRISVKINKLPLKYFDKNQTGDILSRVTNDVDTIAQSMNQSLSSLVSAITLLLGTILMMFITNWIMALTAISASLIGFSIIFVVLSKSQKYFAARQKELGKLNSHIEEVYSGLLVVKAYNGKKEADAKFDEYNEKVYEANRKSQFLSGLMQPIMSFIGNFGYVAVCIVGALLVLHDSITFGVIIAFITYVRLFTSPLMQIAQAFTSLQSTAAASERVFEFLDEEEMSLETNKTKMLHKAKVKGNITFDHVSFGYDKDRTIIKDFTASVKDGQKIAIVGPTGAGKTTMVNLLMKFYEINKGDILIDNVSINDITRENVHSLFTMVLQDTWLFNGTVKENIVYNRENISDEMVKEICDTVGLTHFIKTLPNGFDSVIGENDSVSAGQRQLLTIARGMLEDSPFLILDEATSNVDTRTEELVQKAMDKLTEGRTSFIIAHRLSTIKNADLILVMKDGNIIETGNHDELIKKNGFYADLYNSQFEL